MSKWLNLQFSMLKSQLTKKVKGETVAKSAATSCIKQDLTQNSLLEQIMPVIIRCGITNYTPDGKKIQSCSSY